MRLAGCPGDGDRVTRARIVLAEDHVVIARQLRRLLSSEFDVIDTVADGLALLTSVEACWPDVIVTDIAMPGAINGLAAAQTILAGHPDARIVFVTIRDEPSVIRTALSRGALGYVMKCDAGDELSVAVRTILAGGRYVSTSARAALGELPSRDPA
jgi:DNA-binding NarL/FixJ family response regulator